MEKQLLEIEGFKVGEPLFLKNLILFPLTNGNKDFGRVEILSEAKEKKHIEVRELASPKIDTVIIKNKSPHRVFALDGEGIIGALQDRVINTSALIAEKSEIEIPVSCVEEGRWSGSHEFLRARTISYPSLRAIICFTVSSSLHKTKKFATDQNQIWSSIKKKIESFKITSRTSSLRDIYSSFRRHLESYQEEVAFLKDLNGLLVFAGGRLLCLDLFANKKLFNKLKDQLITSYALDALEIKTSAPPRVGEAKRLFREIKEAKVKTFPSFSLGDEIRFETKDLIGRGLVFNNSLFHLSAFPKIN